jgi:subtilisin family serine protease
MSRNEDPPPAPLDALLHELGPGLDGRIAGLLRAVAAADGNLDDPLVRHLSRHGAVLTEEAGADGSFAGTIEQALALLPDGPVRPRLRAMGPGRRELRIPGVMLAQLAGRAVDRNRLQGPVVVASEGLGPAIDPSRPPSPTPQGLPPRPARPARRPFVPPAPSAPPAPVTPTQLLRSLRASRPVGLPRQRNERDIATGEPGAGTGVNLTANGTALDGTGIIIGFIDYGFDLTHPALRRPDSVTSRVPNADEFGRTRLLALWDQTDPAIAPADFPSDDNRPGRMDNRPGRMRVPGHADPHDRPGDGSQSGKWLFPYGVMKGAATINEELGVHDEILLTKVVDWIRAVLWQAAGYTGGYATSPPEPARSPADRKPPPLRAVKAIEMRLADSFSAQTRDFATLFDVEWLAWFLRTHGTAQASATAAMAAQDLAHRITRRITEGRRLAREETWSKGYNPVAGSDTSDYVGHGTHVASIACGTATKVRRRFQDTAVEFRGIAPKAEIIAVQLDLVEEDWHEGGGGGWQEAQRFRLNQDSGEDLGTPRAPPVNCRLPIAHDHRTFCADAKDEMLERLALRSFEYGDSYALRDALHFIAARAWQEWKARRTNHPTPIRGVVINVSLGAHGGGHDGRSRFEAAADAVIAGWEEECSKLEARPGARPPMLSIVLSAGNAHDPARPGHMGVLLGCGASAAFRWHLPDPRRDRWPEDYVHERQTLRDPTPNELEIRHAPRPDKHAALTRELTCGRVSGPRVSMRPLLRPQGATGRAGIAPFHASASSMNLTIPDAVPQPFIRSVDKPAPASGLAGGGTLEDKTTTIVMVADPVPWPGLDVRNRAEMTGLRHFLESILRGVGPARAVERPCPSNEVAGGRFPMPRPGLISVVVDGERLRAVDAVPAVDIEVVISNPGSVPLEVHAWIERDLEGDKSHLSDLAAIGAHQPGAAGAAMPGCAANGAVLLPPCTLGSLASGRHCIVVGAHLQHPRGEIVPARFSGRGPLPWTAGADPWAVKRDVRDPEPPHLSAPGVGVVGADGGIPGGFGRLTGTSQAVAHVSGTLALMMQAAPRRYSAYELRAMLQRAAATVPVGAPARPNGPHVARGLDETWVWNGQAWTRKDFEDLRMGAMPFIRWHAAMGAGPLNIQESVRLAAGTPASPPAAPRRTPPAR